MKGEALNKTLADTLPRRKAKTLGDKMGDVKAKPQVNALPNTLLSAKAETYFKTLWDVRAEAEMYTFAKTLHLANVKTPLDTVKHLNDTPGDVQAKVLVETKADTL